MLHRFGVYYSGQDGRDVAGPLVRFKPVQHVSACVRVCVYACVNVCV